MSKKKTEVFEFEIDKVLEHGNSIEDLDKRKKYFEDVLEIKKNNKTILDHSIGDRERNFVEEVRAEIEEIALEKHEYTNKNALDDFQINDVLGINKVINAPSIAQDLRIEKFEKECKERGLKKGKTIPITILFDIAKEVGMKVPKDIKHFISGESTYQIAREYVSRLGYKRKRKADI